MAVIPTVESEIAINMPGLIRLDVLVASSTCVYMILLYVCMPYIFNIFHYIPVFWGSYAIRICFFVLLDGRPLPVRKEVEQHRARQSLFLGMVVPEWGTMG